MGEGPPRARLCADGRCGMAGAPAAACWRAPFPRSPRPTMAAHLRLDLFGAVNNMTSTTQLSLQLIPLLYPLLLLTRSAAK